MANFVERRSSDTRNALVALMIPELSVPARELIDSCRAALRPSAEDHARTLEALRTRLQLVHEAPDASVSAGLTSGKLAATIVGLMCTVAVMSLRGGETSDTSTDVSPPSATSSALVNDTQVPPVAVNLAPSSSATTVQSSARSPSAPRTMGPTSDRLNEEVALLMRAEKKWHAGDLNGAIAAVDEHQRRFPGGALAEERTTLRARLITRSAALAVERQ